MALTRTRIEEIEAITWDLISDAYQHENIVPPIEISKIARSLGIDIKFGVFDNQEIDGIFNRQQHTIYINSKNSVERQAFTIAHEIGHYVLHKDKDQETFYRRDRYKFDDDVKPEQEANWFAASLLMPKELLKQYRSMYRSIPEVSYAFMVSSTAAYWRLNNLGY